MVNAFRQRKALIVRVFPGATATHGFSEEMSASSLRANAEDSELVLIAECAPLLPEERLDDGQLVVERLQCGYESTIVFRAGVCSMKKPFCGTTSLKDRNS